MNIVVCFRITQSSITAFTIAFDSSTLKYVLLYFTYK